MLMNTEIILDKSRKTLLKNISVSLPKLTYRINYEELSDDKKFWLVCETKGATSPLKDRFARKMKSSAQIVCMRMSSKTQTTSLQFPVELIDEKIKTLLQSNMEN
jgi:hypothetical protein